MTRKAGKRRLCHRSRPAVENDFSVQPDTNPSRLEPETPSAQRRWRRLRAIRKFSSRRAGELARAIRAAALLALVGVVLFSPLLLDDLVFHASYLMRPSQDSITIDSAAHISTQPDIKLQSGVLSLPPALSGKARTSEALAALVKGGAARLALKTPVFTIDLSPSTRSPSETDISFSEGSLAIVLSPLVDALQGGAFETLMVRDGTVIVKLAENRSERITNLDADIGIKRRSATRIKGSATLRSETVQFDIMLGARIERRGASRFPLKGRVESAMFQATFDGRLDADQTVDFQASTAEVSIPNVRSVARWLGHVWPSGSGLKDFSARGSLDWSGPSITMNRGRYWLDGNEASGALSLKLSTERAQVAGTLAFGTLDVSPYVGIAGQDASAVPSTPLLPTLKAATDVRWPLVGVLDADLRVSAEHVKANAFKAGRSAASLTIRNGQLLFNLAEMLFDGGSRGVGEFAINGAPSNPNYVLRGRLDDVEMAAVSATIAGPPMVRGRGHIVFDMAASGASGLDLLSRLNGKLEAGLAEGGVIACSHRPLSAAARTQAPAELCRSSLNVEPAILSASLSNGILRAERVEVIAGDELLRLSGTADLVASSIDVAITSGVAAKPANGAAPLDRTVMTVRGRPEQIAVTVTPP